MWEINYDFADDSECIDWKRVRLALHLPDSVVSEIFHLALNMMSSVGHRPWPLRRKAVYFVANISFLSRCEKKLFLISAPSPFARLGETKLVEKFSLQLFSVQLIKLNGILNRRECVFFLFFFSVFSVAAADGGGLCCCCCCSCERDEKLFRAKYERKCCIDYFIDV